MNKFAQMFHKSPIGSSSEALAIVCGKVVIIDLLRSSQERNEIKKSQQTGFVTLTSSAVRAYDDLIIFKI